MNSNLAQPRNYLLEIISSSTNIMKMEYKEQREAKLN